MGWEEHFREGTDVVRKVWGKGLEETGRKLLVLCQFLQGGQGH